MPSANGRAPPRPRYHRRPGCSPRRRTRTVCRASSHSPRGAPAPCRCRCRTATGRSPHPPPPPGAVQQAPTHKAPSGARNAADMTVSSRSRAAASRFRRAGRARLWRARRRHPHPRRRAATHTRGGAVHARWDRPPAAAARLPAGIHAVCCAPFLEPFRSPSQREEMTLNRARMRCLRVATCGRLALTAARNRVRVCERASATAF